MDPITFGIIVTALSGVSAILGIGQTGFQLFNNSKRVREIVNEESFIDLSVIVKPVDRKSIQAIVSELKKTAPQANNIMKNMQRRIVIQALIFACLWLSLIMVIGWVAGLFLRGNSNIEIGDAVISVYFIYGGFLVLASVVLLNKFLPKVFSKKLELVDISEDKLKEKIDEYNFRAKMSLENSFSKFGLLNISEQEAQLVDRYLYVVSALRRIQAKTLLLSLEEAERTALAEMKKLGL